MLKNLEMLYALSSPVTEATDSEFEDLARAYGEM